MIIPPVYRLTPEIAELLASIQASREVIESIAIPIEVEANIRRAATLKSSLFSARIEGNPMTLEELTRSSQTQKKLEVMNILKAKSLISKRQNKDLTFTEILEVHKIVMNGLGEAGVFRTNMEAIFNSAGIAIFLPPPPRDLPKLIQKLLKYINSEKEKFVPIKAALAHYSFEKIHPFLDGSGRVGRLILQKILMQGGYGMKGLLPFEEYIDKNRSEYYRMLDEPEKDATDYVVFILEAINTTALETKKMVLAKQKTQITDYLLPRRAEIYEIIKDQKLIQFDQIKRRFAKVNERTLRYDIKKLQDEGLVKKLGTTKGVYYKLFKKVDL